jgi:hypothetical protein
MVWHRKKRGLKDKIDYSEKPRTGKAQSDERKCWESLSLSLVFGGGFWEEDGFGGRDICRVLWWWIKKKRDPEIQNRRPVSSELLLVSLLSIKTNSSGDIYP